MLRSNRFTHDSGLVPASVKMDQGSSLWKERRWLLTEKKPATNKHVQWKKLPVLKTPSDPNWFLPRLHVFQRLIGIWECEELIMDWACHFCWQRPHTPHTLRTFTAQMDCLFFLRFGVRLDTPAQQAFTHWWWTLWRKADLFRSDSREATICVVILHSISTPSSCYVSAPHATSLPRKRISLSCPL